MLVMAERDGKTSKAQEHAGDVNAARGVFLVLSSLVCLALSRLKMYVLAVGCAAPRSPRMCDACFAAKIGS